MADAARRTTRTMTPPAPPSSAVAPPTATAATTRVMCGRRAPSPFTEATNRPPHAPPQLPAAAGESLTHAFLSKRRPVAPISSSSTLATAFPPAFSAAAMSNRMHSATDVDASAYSAALASLRGYAATTTAAARDASGSAQALLALMETERRNTVDRYSNSNSNYHNDSTPSPPPAPIAVSPSPSVASTTSSRQSFASSSTTHTNPKSNDNDDTSDADSVRTNQSAASSSRGTTHPKRKYRKATHTVRKEEKQALELELAALEAQMRELKRRAIGCGDAQTPHDKRVANAVLRNALQQQLAHFADAQVLFSAYGMTQVISPISMPIRLGHDRTERLATLAAMKAQQFARARAFLDRRVGGLDPRKPYCEDQRFETASDGSYCAVRFSVLQFENVASVQQVFDILRFYFCNIEISISEKLGHITIREDDDAMLSDATISQNRLVGTTARNILLESNTIMFSEYFERDDRAGGGEYALLAAEYVDDDALYPYRPEQRVRKDISAILQLTSYRQRKRTTSDGRDDSEDELVVVLTRWSHSRLRRPEFPVPNGAMHEMRENMERWGESMHRIMRETLYPDA